MKYIVFWILVTVSMAAPRSYKDEFGRSFTDMTPRIDRYWDTLSKSFDQIDSARAFMDRANHVRDPRYPWRAIIGKQYIDSVWLDSIYPIRFMGTTTNTPGWLHWPDSVDTSVHLLNNQK